ncbi:MAG: hypothetical protein U9O98_01685 [Asgard group archaeon]|nr:hypothetical protein [Asgard group archaeon]
MADDVMIIKTSGIPLYTKCFGGKTCKKHPDHILQSGFLAALFSFSKETFSKDGIKSVIFNDFKLDFKIDENNDLIIVLANPLEEDDEIIDDHLEKTHNLFLEKYHSKTSSSSIDPDLYLDFDKGLIELDIVPHKSKKDLPLEKNSI